MPVVYGAELTAPVAGAGGAQLNENAETAAFDGVLPEMNHNEICGWGQPTFTAIFVEDDEQHARVKRRIELTADVVGAAGSPVERVRARGERVSSACSRSCCSATSCRCTWRC